MHHLQPTPPPTHTAAHLTDDRLQFERLPLLQPILLGGGFIVALITVNAQGLAVFALVLLLGARGEGLGRGVVVGEGWGVYAF